MPFDTHLLEVMPDTCQWAPFSGEDQWGNPTYGTAIPFQGNVQYNETRGDDGGQQGTVGPIDYRTYTIYSQYLNIQPRDKITLPDSTVTFVDTESTYQDPLVGDPSVQVLQTKEIR